MKKFLAPSILALALAAPVPAVDSPRRATVYSSTSATAPMTPTGSSWP